MMRALTVWNKMPSIGFSHMKSGSGNINYDLKKIRVLLISDVLRFCTDDKIIKAMRLASKTPEVLNDLRNLVGHLKYGKETVYAAVVLAVFNDPKGVPVLKNYQKYWVTSSEIEKLHVRAALLLLNELTNEKLHFANASISPELYKEVQH